MMGDNRDNSTDSRASWGVGYVPFENLVGRAEIIFFSAAVDEPDALRWLSPWTWPFDIRWNRFFKLVALTGRRSAPRRDAQERANSRSSRRQLGTASRTSSCSSGR